MRRALLLVLFAGCLRTTQYQCTSDTQCTAGGLQGTCETSFGYCAFPDPSCASGERFGDLAGSYSQTCVGAMQPDGGIDGMGSGSGSGSGTTDTDGDGVPDTTDNCPTVANADQGNEDADKFGDACDPCPPIADDNPADGDGDGVADACDPNPTAPGDTIVLFEGFHQGVPATWETMGTWTQNGDDVEATGTGNTIPVISTAGSTTTHETVSASLTVVAINGNNNFTGVADDRKAGTASNVSCSIYRSTGITPSPGILAGDGSQTGFMSAGYPAAMTAGSTYTVKLRRDATQFRCGADDGATSASTTLTSSVNNVPSNAGVYVLGSTVRMHWVMVIANP